MRKFFTLIRCVIPSVIFNFYYLPLKQAIRLPIFCYKVNFKKLNGRVIIDASEIKPGMIRLGFPVVRAYPNNGLSFSNEGTITFRGYCTIGGGNSGLVTLKTGHIIFGNDFNSTAGGVIVCAKRIEMGNFVQLGWGTKIIDTNFHPLYDLTQEKCKKGYGAIKIGNNVWLGMDCVCLHSATIPDYSVFAARSVITSSARLESKCVHGGIPAKVIERNIIRPQQPLSITDYGND